MPWSRRRAAGRRRWPASSSTSSPNARITTRRKTCSGSRTCATKALPHPRRTLAPERRFSPGRCHACVRHRCRNDTAGGCTSTARPGSPWLPSSRAHTRRCRGSDLPGPACSRRSGRDARRSAGRASSAVVAAGEARGRIRVADTVPARRLRVCAQRSRAHNVTILDARAENRVRGDPIFDPGLERRERI